MRSALQEKQGSTDENIAALCVYKNKKGRYALVKKLFCESINILNIGFSRIWGNLWEIQ